jgi:xylulokinase
MSLLGIDVGTTGCKAAVFSETGAILASAYREYDIQRPQPGWAELDAVAVWEKVKGTIRQVTSTATAATDLDPIQALSVSSLGEAIVAVTQDHQILGPSLLNFDVRGEAYLESLRQDLDDTRLYLINGNTLGNHYTLTKLLWLKEHRPAIYERAYKFLLWSGFISFMLGAAPAVDYSLANRTLLFDIERETWSDKLLEVTGVDRAKLPDAVPSGTVIGSVSPNIGEDLGLPPDVAIVAGAHDQCANAVGCGVVQEGHAVYGMGTVICITPVFSTRSNPNRMISRRLNTEHHAVPGKYVSFIYNQGGALVKWHRDTFAAAEHQRARQEGIDIYPQLLAEMPEGPSGIMVLPHFTVTGPPDFISDSSGVIAGMRLETTRGDILKGLIEGATFYLRECVETLPATGIRINTYRVAGGGSKSDTWIQISADIMGRPFVRPVITEAGALGSAIIAGTGVRTFSSFEGGIEAMVKLERTFEPDPQRHQRYQRYFETYHQLWSLMQDYLQEL